MRSLIYSIIVIVVASCSVFFQLKKDDKHENLFIVSNAFHKQEKKITKEEFQKLIPKDIPKEYHKLLLETAVYESNLTTGIKQKNGVALGIMQIEPATHSDLYKNFIVYRPALMGRVKELGSYSNHDIQYNTPYSIYIAYLLYRRNIKQKEMLKSKHTRAVLYKRHYNTHKGKGDVLGYLYGR